MGKFKFVQNEFYNSDHIISISKLYLNFIDDIQIEIDNLQPNHKALVINAYFSLKLTLINNETKVITFPCYNITIERKNIDKYGYYAAAYKSLEKKHFLDLKKYGKFFT